MATRDGFFLENNTSTLQRGLKCVGGINPPKNILGKESRLYDVIVIGAGYAGLTACRDLCTAGRSLIILRERQS